MLVLKTNKTEVNQLEDYMYFNNEKVELDSKDLFTRIADLIEDEICSYIDEELANALVLGGDVSPYQIERINRIEYIYHSTLKEPLVGGNVLQVDKNGTWVLN